MDKFTVPVVMTFTSHDPMGVNGIHADIETLFSLSCRATAIATAISAQNSKGINDTVSTPTSLIIEQARAVLDEIPIAAFKIGMVSNTAMIAAIHTILKDRPHIPVVCCLTKDVIGSDVYPNFELATALCTLIAPLSTVLVTDQETAGILAPEADTTDARAQKLMEFGSEYVFIKGCDPHSPIIKNNLYGNHRLIEEFNWDRLPGNYKGCGCTLTAALTGFLAHGLVPHQAVLESQQYTLSCIQQGHRLGLGLKFLARIFGPGNI